ncbi:hypothetical protein NicSoilC12_27730 [Arthrobacter sp. NicSoilC12]|nr:hypothetical protein NicSoilC12_27730 [Arthrobacter sp. NicSoilC12]
MRGAASYWALRAVAATVLLGAAASCSSGTAGGTASPASATASATPIPAGPVTAEISQFRDNYSKQIIEIQLTNTTGHALTVLGAELTSPLFAAPIIWSAHTGGIELPPGQPKSLPAPLPGPDCGSPAGPGATSGAAGDARVSLRLATPGGAVPVPAVTPATDPFGVLARNNSELCLAREASAVATIALDPELEVAADGRTAVVRLLLQPRAAGAGAGEMVIDRIEETTLLAEAGQTPWPRSVTVRAGGTPAQVRLGIRPSRCDPHAVAEDKVGTLLPLQVRVAGREGILKIDAGSQLRARIYDFVTKACGRQ